jgi:hypothetical protein
MNNASSGFSTLLQRYVTCNGTDSSDLARMYSLFVRLPDSETSGITPTADMFREFVTTTGMDVVDASQGKESDKLVERHVEKYHLFHKLVNGAFCSDHRFQLAMKVTYCVYSSLDPIVTVSGCYF